MIALIVFAGCALAALGAGIAGAVSDYRGMRIPNAYPAVITCLFFPAWGAIWLGGGSEIFSALWVHLAVGAFAFAVTYAMFVARVFGAGDAKLVTAFAFWTGWTGLPAFLFFLTVFGMFLALATLALRRWTPIQSPAPGSWVARAQGGEKVVPYGIAITAGAMVAFHRIGFFDPQVLSSLVR